MGKASKSKRERRARGAGGSLPAIEVPSERRSLPVFWIVIALMVVGGLAALVLSAPDEAAKAREAEAANAPVYADVRVDGTELPTWSGTGKDDAVGKAIPTIDGTNIDGESESWMAGDGTARAYVVMAHWCPHCQAEIPRLVEWAEKNELPTGVEVVGVSTSVDKGQTNFPPATWLARENWTWPVLVDDEIGTASDALGVEGFPFMVFTDSQGKVVSRHSGEMPIEEWAGAIDSIAPGTD